MISIGPSVIYSVPTMVSFSVGLHLLSWFRHPILWHLLFNSLTVPIHPEIGAGSEFRWWHYLVLLLSNPFVVVNYNIVFTFVYCLALLLYGFLCYGIRLYLLVHLSYRAW